MINAHYADNLVLLAIKPAQVESLLHSIEKSAKGIGFPVNAVKTEFMCFKQEGAPCTFNGKPLKSED